MSAALMDAPVAAAIGDLMVVRATPAIGRIDLTAMAIGLTVMGIAGAIKQQRGTRTPDPIAGGIVLAALLCHLPRIKQVHPNAG